MIEVRNLCKTFRVHRKQPGLLGSVRALFYREWIEKHALADVSVKIEAGEIVGLIGANGAGKTTLVKILAGIIYPTSGTAQILGHTPWQRKNAFRRRISLIMGQKAQLWWDLPAMDCFLLLREIYQIPRKKFQQNLALLTESLHVEKLLNIQIRRLSLGERMKMELIAALLHDPKVVFLDEPTIGLDITAQRSIRDFILQYRQQHQPAMILTSHYMKDIEQLCRRIVVIREGKFIYDGPLTAILSEYARYKIIIAHLALTKNDSAKFPEHLGEVLDSNEGTLQVKVLREKVPQAVAAILEQFSISDLTIEEEKIETVIESFLGERH